jgi:hypothetical protein
MSQIKLAAVLMAPLVFFGSISAAQERETGCVAKTPPVPLKDENYGSYIPYTGPLLGKVPQECPVTADQPPASNAPNMETAFSIASQPPPLVLKADTQTPIAASPTCEPPTPRKDEVYGKYVPYTGPLLGKVPTCKVATLPAGDTPNLLTGFDNSSPLNLSSAPGFAKSTAASPQLKPALPANNDLAIAPAPSPGEPSSTSEYVRPIPTHRAPTIPVDVRPFHSIAIGFKADTLGLGVELATPMTYKINLRSSMNFLAFDAPFSIHGVDYDARLHLKSSETTVDWFPRAEGGFHISPGFLYAKNTMSAPVSVAPGQTFVLGTQTFLNSVDDPMRGTSSVVYARSFSPMLLLGYGNIIPRSYKHFSVPFEFGAAYTGAPQINVTLNGTACTTDGCVNFAGNTQAQAYVTQEVHKLNEDLKRFPVIPILSIGVAYHF